ncbi:MAG: ribosomal RNA small subunit methyltransferase E (16S rRNA m3U1498 methyltransferase) [uncultured bacterium]|nr:MAG: ribosomal RNA small subunit methyltransferase E (16S rRNA m3U1498 methyltransferase) [uncultured bacterium]
MLSPHVSEGLNAKNLDKTTPCLLLIGPEGGLSDNEIEIAKQHDFKPIALGQRVLRTETATIVALSVFQAYAGDL